MAENDQTKSATTTTTTTSQRIGKDGKKVRDRRVPKQDSEGQLKERTRKLDAKAKAAASGMNSIPLGGGAK